MFWGCYSVQCNVTGVGCSSSIITPSSSRIPVVAAGWVRVVDHLSSLVFRMPRNPPGVGSHAAKRPGRCLSFPFL